MLQSRYCTMVSVDSVSKKDPNTCCAVCLKAFENPSGIAQRKKYVKKLKCGHVFHASCIDQWLARAPNCPCCREELHEDPHCVIEYIDFILVDRRQLLRNEHRRNIVSHADLYE